MLNLPTSRPGRTRSPRKILIVRRDSKIVRNSVHLGTKGHFACAIIMEVIGFMVSSENGSNSFWVDPFSYSRGGDPRDLIACKKTLFCSSVPTETRRQSVYPSSAHGLTRMPISLRFSARGAAPNSVRQKPHNFIINLTTIVLIFNFSE